MSSGCLAESDAQASVDRQMAWALEQLQRLKTDGFHGRLILSFHEGAVTHAEQQQSLKPPK